MKARKDKVDSITSRELPGIYKTIKEAALRGEKRALIEFDDDLPIHSDTRQVLKDQGYREDSYGRSGLVICWSE